MPKRFAAILSRLARSTWVSSKQSLIGGKSFQIAEPEAYWITKAGRVGFLQLACITWDGVARSATVGSDDPGKVRTALRTDVDASDSKPSYLPTGLQWPTREVTSSPQKLGVAPELQLLSQYCTRHPAAANESHCGQPDTCFSVARRLQGGTIRSGHGWPEPYANWVAIRPLLVPSPQATPAYQALHYTPVRLIWTPPWQLIHHDSQGEGSGRPDPFNLPHQAVGGVHPVYNLANGISVARLASGPVMAGLVIHHQWLPALALLSLAGVSDWLDGFVARRYAQPSVLGSYLDPLADKVFVGCAVGALVYEGSIPGPIGALIIGRDFFLIAGACFQRFQSLGWKWPGTAEFFHISPASLSEIAQGSALPNQPSPAQGGPVDVPNQASAVQAGLADVPNRAAPTASGLKRVAEPGQEPAASSGMIVGSRALPDQAGRSRAQPDQAVSPAKLVQPLFISKVNTVLQMGLVGGCVTSSLLAWPSEATLWVLGGVTAATTCASAAMYLRTFLRPRE
eukprot:jgi/Botrbrau1/19185/Bobra.0077s0091.1